MNRLSDLGLRAFREGLDRHTHCGAKFFETLPLSMRPSEARRLLTSSFAIHATALHCVNFHLDRFHSLRPLTVVIGERIKFDPWEDKWTDLPTSPRSPVPDTGLLFWREIQQILKAFWMIYIARLFSASHKRRGFEMPERENDMEVDDLRPIDLFEFERQGKTHRHWMNRPRDYLFRSMQLFLTAEEYLKDAKPAYHPHLATGNLLCKRISGDTQNWHEVSETMEHFVRLFKEIRSLEHEVGFYSWRRRLGFAIWDIERLRTAGLVHNPRHDSNDDRPRWLSVTRREDFGSVQNHRLIVSGLVKESAEFEGEDYTYPDDSDESLTHIPWDFADYVLPEESRKSLSLEFGIQARGASWVVACGME